MTAMSNSRARLRVITIRMSTVDSTAWSTLPHQGEPTERRTLREKDDQAHRGLYSQRAQHAAGFVSLLMRQPDAVVLVRLSGVAPMVLADDGDRPYQSSVQHALVWLGDNH